MGDARGPKQIHCSKSTEDKSFLVVGLVRNCGKYLPAEIERLTIALGNPKKLHWLLIESDSADASLSALEEIKYKVPDFEYISLGTLCNEMPLRTERLAYCRNRYIEEIRRNDDYKDIDYVIVSDFDGLNTHISEAAITSCWERSDWDVCTANQKGPYFDIWALRHENWSPNDCWAQYMFFNRYNPTCKENLRICVRSRMIKVPYSSEWIEVDSAFGGLAIYRKKAFYDANYIGLTELGEEVCEHVPFHKALKQKKYRIFINPKMLNTDFTDATEYFRFKRRLNRKTQSWLKQGIRATVGNKFYETVKQVIRGGT